jgi:hypothetical protein
MAYSQWIKVTIESRNLNIGVQNAYLGWGKFHAEGNKDREISNQEITSIVVHDGESKTISSCGRENASNGTAGRFDLYDGGTKIGTFSWDNPWGGKRNDLSA